MTWQIEYLVQMDYHAPGPALAPDVCILRTGPATFRITRQISPTDYDVGCVQHIPAGVQAFVGIGGWVSVDGARAALAEGEESA